MNFKELQQGYSVYIFDRTEIGCKSCPVVSVSQPRFDNKIGQQPQMVLDLTIDDSGTRKTFVVPDSSRAYTNNVVISTEKPCILAEIRALKQTSDNIINSVEKHKEISLRCEELLSELDTDFKERKAADTRMSAMEGTITSLKDDVKRLSLLIEDMSRKNAHK